ncbi:murein biosynthesis integral membrane protein MurJ [Virgisporangium aurantiacum]|uniref:Membrane protein n=1 Tax=Virgisporangium aurantiacum TaxID=175570 RepID=A0A8J3ZHZ5_9ACTN|nr:lipid II flippase MurJ [Virgisporangium aurantiacum]GIJ61763.1 membrane protein [Virgisporangium aurantiacum]
MAGARLARAASMIAALTVASRVAGFGRILVFTWAVGLARLGDLYQAANTVPNIIFEIVAGGALASLVVPVLAAPLRDGDRETVQRTVSAQLTWVVTILAPVALVLALVAEPVVRLLVKASPDDIETGATMLRIFAPQLPLYGIGVVLAGVLQAHRRFVWPVLAPLLSSVTVALVYVAFALRAGPSPDVAAIDGVDLALLAGGTTLAVAVLTLCLVVPVRRLGLRIRPTYRLGAVAGPVRRLAAAGVVTVGAQQASLALVIAFAGRGPAGSVAMFALAQTVFLLPWAVLAVPIATAAFPTLAAKEADGDRDGFAATTATALRATLLVTAAGAALLVAVAPDAAITLAALDSDRPDPAPLAAGIAAFGPGVIGYGLFALLSRALYARHRPAAVATATAVGWAAIAAAAVVLSQVVPDGDRVAALAAGHSVGLTVLGVALLVSAHRRIGPAALAGAGRAALVGLGAAAAGTAVALAARTITVPDRPGVPPALLRGVLCAVLVVVVFTAVAYAADRHDVRPALARVRRLIKRE